MGRVLCWVGGNSLRRPLDGVGEGGWPRCQDWAGHLIVQDTEVFTAILVRPRGKRTSRRGESGQDLHSAWSSHMDQACEEGNTHTHTNTCTYTFFI